MGKARDYIPALKYGHKILPSDIAGMIGLPYVNDIFYVDGSAGSDTSARVNDPSKPYKTVSAAFDATTANKHDVVMIVPSGGSGRVSEATAITWNKRFTHLIGNAAPTAQDARAGIGFATGGSLTISENGCLFKNLTMFSSADIDETVSVTGDYNSFLGVDFKGTSNATSADSTPWRALNINGGQENYFGGCTFGADTYTRGTTNATLELENRASRNVFEDCRFVMYADNVGPNHLLLTGDSAIDTWVEFKNCSWYSMWANDVDKITHVIDAAAQAATGHILMTGFQVMIGADDWEAADSGHVYFQPASATANAIGIAINPAVT